VEALQILAESGDSGLDGIRPSDPRWLHSAQTRFQCSCSFQDRFDRMVFINNFNHCGDGLFPMSQMCKVLQRAHRRRLVVQPGNFCAAMRALWIEEVF
jgi:hypothetical protein